MGLLRDLISVQESLHQDTAVSGPWMEARIKEMLRGWLPGGWQVSGPGQVFCRGTHSIRSRSWDIIVHRRPEEALPPPASPEFGFPLLPKEIVAAVIDTKTNFAGVAEYASKPAFNLMNDFGEPQLKFLGGTISPFILAATSQLRPDQFYKAGLEYGLGTFSLAIRKSDLVSAGEERVTRYMALRFMDGSYPLQRFKTALLTTLSKCPDWMPSPSG